MSNPEGRRAAFAVHNHLLALDAAEQGMGIALVPELFVESALSSGRLVHVLGGHYPLDTRNGFYMVTAEPVASDTALGTVVEWLMAEAAAHR